MSLNATKAFCRQKRSSESTASAYLSVGSGATPASSELDNVHDFIKPEPAHSLLISVEDLFECDKISIRLLTEEAPREVVRKVKIRATILVRFTLGLCIADIPVSQFFLGLKRDTRATPPYRSCNRQIIDFLFFIGAVASVLFEINSNDFKLL